MHAICTDLIAEHAALDALVESLDEAGWNTPTPAPGWSVRDQVSHLWFFDERALMALTDVEAFEADKQLLMAGGGTDSSVLPGRATTGADMMSRWRESRARLYAAAELTDPAARIPWYGPAMGARSFITARLMETWAHGQDVADALGVQREATERLRHVAHIGVRARPFSYAINQMTMPTDEISVVLTAPNGEVVTWGPSDSTQQVHGPMLDFCLVVTQRRHLVDTNLSVQGHAAVEWISIAQAFAGAPGVGREPGQFAG